MLTSFHPSIADENRFALFLDTKYRLRFIHEMFGLCGTTMMWNSVVLYVGTKNCCVVKASAYRSSYPNEGTNVLYAQSFRMTV